jgi:type IV secretion system protein VirB5
MKKTIRRLTLPLILAWSILGGNAAHAQGIPVIDVANLVNSYQQVVAWGGQYGQMAQQYAQQLKEYTTLYTQYLQIKQQYESLTGTRNLGDILNNPAFQNVVPVDFGQPGGSLTGAAQALRQASQVYDCAGRTDMATCKAALSSLSQGQAFQQSSFQLVSQRSGQIQSLQSQINMTTDPKGISELQARIQAENTQVANDSNKIALAQMMADSQRIAAQQALRENTLQMLSPATTSLKDTWHFDPSKAVSTQVH